MRGIVERRIDRALYFWVYLQVFLESKAWALEERIARSRQEEGQSLVEYAIILALIAVAVMAAIQALGGGIVSLFQRLLSRIQGIG